MSNGSSITPFLLLAFADTRELQLLHFWLFLGIYLAALLGNGFIITAIACDRCLHTSMYFFLLNLALLDLGSISTTLPKAMANSLPLCRGNALDQFFCEIPQILKLSCSDSYLREVGLLVVSLSVALGCFVFIVLSYLQIFRAVLRVPSEQGRHKAFSTCLPHLAVVSVFISSGLFAYLKPPSISSPSMDLLMAVLYSVVPPAVNPLIYSMRNQELKDALKKLFQSVVFQQQ
ncbi:PREDICTED: olfactory receptor 14J1-like [Aptenodytes forsteri]|uniref:olfactory receptor 14J1-like n=1 Tax=Aptenodytes forsteri TaxID=9233 RepID=UPI0009049FAA|nr:PREDICTED: olfactory receptor 14J1-like [Aptenodytes forsteri]